MSHRSKSDLKPTPRELKELIHLAVYRKEKEYICEIAKEIV